MQDLCHVPYSMSHRMLAREAAEFGSIAGLKKKKIRKLQRATFGRLRSRYEGYDFRALPKLYYLLLGLELKKLLKHISFFSALKYRFRLFFASLVTADATNSGYLRAVENCKQIATPDQLVTAFGSLSPQKQAALIELFDFDPMSHQKFRLDFEQFEAKPKRVTGAFNALAKRLKRSGLKEAFSWILQIESSATNGKLPEGYLQWIGANKNNLSALEQAEQVWVLFSGSLNELNANTLRR